MTDFYRSKLYAAERAAFKDQPRVSRTIEDCEARIRTIAQTCVAWQRAVKDGPHRGAWGRGVEVRSIKGGTSYANSNFWRISVADWHRGNDWVLIHEMAHLPIPDSFQSHGREFNALYLAMVSELYSPEIADRLATEMAKRKVPYDRTGWDAKLRGYLRTILKPGYEAYDVCVILEDGSRNYIYSPYAPRLQFDAETGWITYRATAEADASQTAWPLERVAYIEFKNGQPRLRKW